MAIDRDDARAHNRRMMPKVAADLAWLTKLFGPDTRLVYASENGYEVGTKASYTISPHHRDKVRVAIRHEEYRVGPKAQPIRRRS